MDFTQNKVSCIHIVYVEIFVLFLCRKKNNFRIPKRKAPGVRIKKAKYVQQQNVICGRFGFSLLYQIPENRNVYSVSLHFEDQFNYSLIKCSTRVGWGGMG